MYKLLDLNGKYFLINKIWSKKNDAKYAATGIFKHNFFNLIVLNRDFNVKRVPLIALQMCFTYCTSHTTVSVSLLLPKAISTITRIYDGMSKLFITTAVWQQTSTRQWHYSCKKHLHTANGRWQALPPLNYWFLLSLSLSKKTFLWLCH